jgi:hypothetical protein
VQATGVTQAITLDPSICAVSITTDAVNFTGVSRGDVLVLVWFNERRESWLISVVDPPFTGRIPRWGALGQSMGGSGMFGSTLQTVSGDGRSLTYVLSNRMYWSEAALGGRFSVASSFQDLSTPGTPSFNITSATAQYSRKNLDVALFDSAVDFTGGQGGATRFSQYANFNLRGVNVGLQHGDAHYQFFAGTSVPYVFTKLSDTRDLFGMSYTRKLSPKFSFNVSTAATNVPVTALDGTVERQTDFFELTGMTWKPTANWTLQGAAGGGTGGALGLASGSYTSVKFNMFAAYSRSSSQFPLNKLETLSAGDNSLTLGTTYQLSQRISASGYYQHVVTPPNLFGGNVGSSDYINPTMSFLITQGQRLYANYVYSRNSGSTAFGPASNRRFDATYFAQFGRIGNTVQSSFVSSGDASNLQSQNSYSYGDTVSVKLGKGVSVSSGVTSFHSNLSLENRLNQQLALLPPVLQQLFLTNPNAFIQSVNFTPELRSILDTLQPGSTQANVSAQFSIGSRLSIAPYFNYTHLSESANNFSNTHQFGYTVGYRLSESVQITSSLTSLYLIDPVSGLRRTTVFSIGFNKSLSGYPRQWLPFHLRHYAIHGHVFRDMNLNGVFNAGEAGMPGIVLTLSNGETATTDAEGRYQFLNMSGGSYEVALSLDHFHEPVRVTSATNRSVVLGGKQTGEVDFGVVNFARVSGMVFNDYLNDSKRQPDADGMPGIKVTLANANASRDIVTEPDGSFEVTDMQPGDYEITVDRRKRPANYIAPAQSIHMHLSPTASLVRDLPIQAVRSLSGTVLLKVKDDDVETLRFLGIPAANSSGQEITVPLAGVQLSAGNSKSVTDKDGNFVLRNLPAGELTLSFVVRQAVPAGVQVPSGKFKVVREPVQIQGTTIVISNPKLVPYLVPQPQK